MAETRSTSDRRAETAADADVAGDQGRDDETRAWTTEETSIVARVPSKRRRRVSKTSWRVLCVRLMKASNVNEMSYNGIVHRFIVIKNYPNEGLYRNRTVH